MNKEQFMHYAGQLYRDLRNTKIVFLSEDSKLLEAINGGDIPAFENGGELQVRTEKVDSSTGKKSAVIRPYLICYNSILKCNVLYVMTGSRTIEQIKNKRYYDSVITPECLYDYIDSVLTDGRLDMSTHTKANLSTVSLTRAIPIPNEITKKLEAESMVDWANGDFDSRDIPILREFMSHFYGKVDESFITRATKSGRAQEWFLDKEDFVSWQKLSRPSAIYTAMFINFALSEIENPKATNPLKLRQLKNMVEGATTAYLDYLRFMNEVDGYKRLHSKVYRAFFEAKYNIAITFRSNKYEDAYHEVMSSLECPDSVRGKVRELLIRERQIDKNLSLAVNVAISYFNGESRRVNISEVQMNESLFHSFTKMAGAFSDSKYKALVESWNKKINARFDEQIAQLEERIQIAKQEKEREEYRRRREKEEQLRKSTTITERAKRAVENALDLYHQFYKVPFANLLSGQLYNTETKHQISDFVKLFTTYADGSGLSMKKVLRDIDERDAQNYLSDRILAMSEFTSVMDSSRIAIEESDKARKMQAYIKSRSNRIGGDEGEAVERAIELMTLIHEEYERARKLKHSNNEDNPVANIIKKVLKDETRYSIVDFSSGSSAKAYFDDMLLVHQVQENVANVSEIFSMRVEALWAMQDLKVEFEQLLEAYEILRGKITGAFEEEIKAGLQKKSLDEYLSVCEKEILQILQNGNIDLDATIDEIRAYKKRQSAMIEKEIEAVESFVIVCAKSVMEYGEYLKRWEESNSGISRMILTEKRNLGFAPEEGVSEGHFVGKIHRVIVDTETGEKSEESESEEHAITDLHVIEEIFSRTIPNPVEIESKVKDRMKGLTNIFELIDELSSLERNAKAWTTNLNESYDAVRNLYISMLEYRKKIKESGERFLASQRCFVEEFKPMSSFDGHQLIQQENIPAMKEAMSRAFGEYEETIISYFEEYLPSMFIACIIDYFNAIDTRTDIAQPAYDYVNINRITGKQVLYTIDAKKQINVLDAINGYYRNSIIIEDAIQNAYLRDIVSMQEFREINHAVLPILEYEFMFQALKIMSEVLFATTVDDALVTKLQRDDVLDITRMLCGQSESGYTYSDSLYEYLIKKLPEFDEYVQVRFTKFMANSAIAQAGFSLTNQSMTKLLRLGQEASEVYDGCNDRNCAIRAFKWYHTWLSRLHKLDRVREERDKEVILQLGDIQRDVAREKRILSGDTTPFGIFIEITDEN